MNAAASAIAPRTGRFARLRAALLRRAERRMPALTRYRKPEALPAALHRRRIYVLPTRFGLAFAVLLHVMLLGALNFSNNAAMLLTFMVAGAAMVSLHATVRQLDGLALTALRADPVHAGESLKLQLQLMPGDRRPRPRIEIAVGDGEARRHAIAGGGEKVTLPLVAPRRGAMATERLTLSTEFPFGLFRAWSVVQPDQSLLVYPRPERGQPPLPGGGGGLASRRLSAVGEDWSGLRDYRGGDARRLIAWKASARQQRLLVKELADPAALHLVLDWEATGVADRELRIERLTRWVLDASARQASFSLLLPGQRLGPGRGLAHRAACLRALALLP